MCLQVMWKFKDSFFNSEFNIHNSFYTIVPLKKYLNLIYMLQQIRIISTIYLTYAPISSLECFILHTNPGIVILYLNHIVQTLVN